MTLNDSTIPSGSIVAEPTPGPWSAEIEEHRAPSDWFAAAIGVGNPYEGNYRTLARIASAEHSYDEAEVAQTEANARLIAAAPELLAVLKRSHLALNNALEIRRIDCRCRIANGCDPHEWLLEMEQAIAKAEGRPS